LYTWNTPNGRKISIMLEELGLFYNVFPIYIGKGKPYSPEYLTPSAEINLLFKYRRKAFPGLLAALVQVANFRHVQQLFEELFQGITSRLEELGGIVRQYSSR